jgi:putative N6-adenine-specific DNA methylase
MGTERSVEALYKKIGETFRALAPWQVYIITSHPDFERLYGKRADKVRKLYNGMIPCYLYQYFKNKKG